MKKSLEGMQSEGSLPPGMVWRAMGAILHINSSIQIGIVNGDGVLANEQVGSCQGSPSTSQYHSGTLVTAIGLDGAG